MKITEKAEHVLLNILRQAESLKEGIICFAYKDETGDYYNVCLSDYELYMSSDLRYERMRKAWRVICKKNNVPVLFSFRSPSEKMFEELLKEDNLLIVI